MRILITGVGGPTPRSFAMSLKKYSSYKNYELIATDANPLTMGLYHTELFNKSYIVPKCTDEGYWNRINEIVAENQIELAVILPELEVIEWSKRNKEGFLPCKTLLPDFRIASLLVDKARMSDILEPLDFVPPSIEFSFDLTDFSQVFEKLGNSFWVRSTKGTSGLGSLRIDNLDSLVNWIKINTQIETFIASKFLSGRNLACKLLFYNGKIIRAACAERINYIMAKVAPSGVTGNTSFGRLLNEPNLVDISIKAMNQIFEDTQTEKHGFFTVDFKEDENGKPFITEINVRHVAFTQCFAAAGANFAEDTIRLLENDHTFDMEYKMYEFENGTIFLRDVDDRPILMNEKDLLKI